MIRVVLPYHLRNLGRIDGEVRLEVTGDITIRSVLNALEERYPMLAGTIRDHATQHRRPFVRFFACGEDLSLESSDVNPHCSFLKQNEGFQIIFGVKSNISIFSSVPPYE